MYVLQMNESKERGAFGGFFSLCHCVLICVISVYKKRIWMYK